MEKFVYETTYQIEKDHWWFRVRRILAMDLLEKYKPGSKDVLEVGCGTGLLLLTLSNKGKRVFGLDMSDEAIKFCESRGLKDIRLGEATAMPFEDHMFDAVFCLDVLEHISDDKKALEEMERVLKPGGIMILFVPAFTSLWGIQDVIGHHHRRYVLSSLREKLGSRWKIRKKSYFNFFLSPPIFLVRFIVRIFKIRIDTEAKLNNPAFNFIFFSIFRIEVLLLRHFSFPFGVSALLVAQKEE